LTIGVLDASAILAVYFGEPGAEIVERIMFRSLVSSVNYTEVVSKSLDRGRPLDNVIVSIAQMGLAIVSHDQPLALRAGTLRPATRRLGLSIGDRACLALAERERLPAYTTDRTWTKLGLAVDVRLIR
jgi:PIN domain nuclease of toxin-antitoxin system